MNDKIKNLLFIIELSVLLSAFVVFLYIIDPNEWSDMKISGAVIFSFWAFCVPPSAVYWYNWLKGRTFAEGMRIGIILGKSVFFIFIIIAPVFATLYYLDAIKNWKK
jgi:hypothetical protein